MISVIRIIPPPTNEKGVNISSSDKRTYLFVDPSKRDEWKHTRESVVRASWYFIHQALAEDEVVQKKGMYVMQYLENAKLSHLTDRKLAKQMLISVQGCLPVRLSAIHILYPPSFFRHVFSIVKIFMRKRTRKRFVVHSGSQEQILDNLERKYSLTKADLPEQIGGERKCHIVAGLLVVTSHDGA